MNIHRIEVCTNAGRISLVLEFGYATQPVRLCAGIDRATALALMSALESAVHATNTPVTSALVSESPALIAASAARPIL